MRFIKNLFSKIFSIVVTVFTTCAAVDFYKKYTTDPVWRANLKEKIKKLNPFKK